MRMVSSIFLSIAFHAAIFALPVAPVEKGGGEIIPVVLLVDRGVGPAKKREGARETQKTAPRRIKRQKKEADEPKSKEPILSELAKEKSETPPRRTEVSEAPSESDEAETGASAEAMDSALAGLSAAIESAGGEVAEAGMGREERNKGGSPAGIGFTQADYAYTPKPDYPERARREGWEGTVLLAVLVDRRGGSKTVEVSRSSGFQLLDRAAVEAVKLWRFHPAHAGETKIASWVKIPVVFRLD